MLGLGLELGVGVGLGLGLGSGLGSGLGLGLGLGLERLLRLGHMARVEALLEVEVEDGLLHVLRYREI